MVNIELHEFKTLLMEAAALGAAMAVKAKEPKSDIMHKREAVAYLMQHGYRASKLDELHEAGLVRFDRLSKAKNSPVVVSRCELIAAVSAVKKLSLKIN